VHRTMACSYFPVDFPLLCMDRSYFPVDFLFLAMAEAIQ
jgi:hypothetical protein